MASPWNVADHWLITLNRRSRFLAMAGKLHPKNAESGLGDGGIEAGRKCKRQYAARIGGRDDAVVPEARCGEVRIAFRFVAGADRCAKFFLFGAAPAFAARFHAIPF